jgi:hypothetical protein
MDLIIKSLSYPNERVDGTNSLIAVIDQIGQINKKSTEYAFYKLPIVTNNIWIVINSDAAIWNNPVGEHSNEIAVYWDEPLQTNDIGQPLWLGMTFGRKSKWLQKIPDWTPISIRKRVSERESNSSGVDKGNN